MNAEKKGGEATVSPPRWQERIEARRAAEQLERRLVEEMPSRIRDEYLALKRQRLL